MVSETHLEDIPTAIESYRDILDLNPGHEGARENLRKLGLGW